MLKFGVRFLRLRLVRLWNSVSLTSWKCRNVFLNDDEEEVMGDSSNADEGYQDDMKLKRVDKNASNLFFRFFHNPYNPLKLITVLIIFLDHSSKKIDILLKSFECNL